MLSNQLIMSGVDSDEQDERFVKWVVSIKIEGKWEKAIYTDRSLLCGTLESLLQDYKGQIEELRIVSVPSPPFR